MIFEQGLDSITRNDHSVVTVGTFDGVHLGHRKIICDLIDRAQQYKGLSTVITFDPHPREVLLQEKLTKLTTIQERASILSSLGLDRLVVVPFTQEFSQISPERFVTEFLFEAIGLQSIVIGYDHRFGKDRKGDINLLNSLGQRLDFSVREIAPHVEDGGVVSSRAIRNLLHKHGDIVQATKLLTYPYTLTGTVITGDGRGRELGYPTANIRLIDPDKVIPAHGIYVVHVDVSGIKRGGIMSIGTRPTILDSKGVHLEVNILDFSESIYGQELTVYFIKKIRDQQHFDTLDELRIAMIGDEEISREILEHSK
ncbi:MAG: bifunctional riboflavin kinase/FAD synthetase [Bacteroidetes bacterium]|nr:bifunctional riboflavin kinase/FAD synthetase [Bacteroidota bacterium]